MKIRRLIIVYFFVILLLVFIGNIVKTTIMKLNPIQNIDNYSQVLDLENEDFVVLYYSKSEKLMSEDMYYKNQVKNINEDVYIAAYLTDSEENSYVGYEYYPIKINGFTVTNNYDGKVDEKNIDLNEIKDFMIVDIEITNMYDGDRIYTLPFNAITHYENDKELDKYNLLTYIFEDNRPYYYRKNMISIVSNDGYDGYGEIILKANESLNFQAFFSIMVRIMILILEIG